MHTAPEKHKKKQSFKNDKFSVELGCQGENEYIKASFPVKYGLFSRFETRDIVFEFNLNHEIRHAKAKTKKWIHPSEWLKRSIGNDWIYYSTGGYSGVFEALGEYYLPNLMYPTNSLLGGKPFETRPIQNIIKNWHSIICDTCTDVLPDPFKNWFKNVQANAPDVLEKKAAQLFNINGSRASVLPPDARHVDYNIIPVNISDGCLYKCRFCKIKNKKPFSVRSLKNIETQIQTLQSLYGPDILNYNALFLGEHDALNSPDEIIFKTLENSCTQLGLKQSFMKGAFLFLFGSVDSLLNKNNAFFKELDKTGFQTFINIGLESCDPATLDRLGKPLTEQKVIQAFEKIQTINAMTSSVEITCNFIMDEGLPSTHYPAMMSLIRDNVTRSMPKGTIYLSPLKFGHPSRQVLYDFYKLKTQSRFPLFLYLIQRL